MRLLEHWEPLIYALAVPAWFYLWHLLVGFRWLKVNRLMFIPLFGCCFVLGCNLVTVSLTRVPDYATELALYPYVEHNAAAAAGFALAMAVFVLVQARGKVPLFERPVATKFTYLVLWAFLLSIVGCLPLYWMPPVQGSLTLLRHLKTVPYTFSLFILAAGILIFLGDLPEGGSTPAAGANREKGPDLPA